MEDTRRSLSPSTRLYNEFHDFVPPGQRDRLASLVNSAVASNSTVSDEELARQQQECLYNESLMHVDEPPVVNTDALNADAAYAFQLQEEEYSRESIAPYQTHNQGSNNRSYPYFNELAASDAEIAAQLQAEENQRRSRFRPIVPPQRRTSHPTSDTDAPESIPFPFAEPRPDRDAGRGNNNRNRHHGSLALRILAPHGRRNRDIPNIPQDFGPNDYEQLLQLDDGVGKTPLTNDQINRLPTEKFRRPVNKNDEENKCSVCWDQFEQNQTLRRLPCLHLYHQDCIDNWLKVNNLCPICRMPPIK